MTEFPRGTISPDMSDAEHVKRLLEIFKQCNYMPFDSHLIHTVSSTLHSLSQYVTLISFNEKGEFGTVDIEVTIQNMWNSLERQDKTYLAYGFHRR